MHRLRQFGTLILIVTISMIVKSIAAHNMPFDIDIVPVLSRNIEYGLTPVGTLSSVAAYNMPMLEWIHLPAMWVFRDAWWVMFSTLMLVNLAGSLAVYQLGKSLFGESAGLMALAVFSFCEVGISSSFTAWAQLLLPSFYALVMLCLWLWYAKDQSRYLALAGILATMAFMIHFSAILLYPAMLVVALLLKARWKLRGLVAGTVIVLLLFAPYVLFEIPRGFADLRAFLSQQMQITPEVLESVQRYKPEAQVSTSPAQAPSIAQTPETPAEPLPRWQRAILYGLSIPLLIVNGLHSNFVVGVRGFESIHPSLATIAQPLLWLPEALFWLSVILASWRMVQKIRRDGWQDLRHSAEGRIWLLLSFILVMILGMIITRSIGNSTYLIGLTSIQIIIASYALTHIQQPLFQRIVVIGVVLYCAVYGTERVVRISTHDDTAFSSYHVGLYRHIEAVTDFIAEDWQGGDALTIGYDFLPETPEFWWVPAWNTIDTDYRMGMTYDFLLSWHHGLVNLNTDPVGTVENPDYQVIYRPALRRYDESAYEIVPFGAILVLKPLTSP